MVFVVIFRRRFPKIQRDVKDKIAFYNDRAYEKSQSSGSRNESDRTSAAANPWLAYGKGQRSGSRNESDR